MALHKQAFINVRCNYFHSPTSWLVACIKWQGTVNAVDSHTGLGKS